VSGTLYIVATPIGNLGDLTPRAKQVFEQVDFIAAEDTRVTLKLLNHLGIKKPMVSYYEHNLRQRGAYILERIQAGENCALCSDAGMPAISDPGELIVRDAHAMGVPVVPVPAASAAVTALAVSGQDTGRFVFEGFLPTNRRQKKERLDALRTEQRTMIFYEAPHKLLTTLQDLEDALGADRSMTVCRELTKLHEEIRLTTVGDANRFYKENAPRGEFVLVVAGCPAPSPAELTLDDAVAMALARMEQGESATAAAKAAAAASLFSKSEIYRRCLELQEQE
jgi:16S rRNA (cytidine1402-2'-O)-methyltransferase